MVSRNDDHSAESSSHAVEASHGEPLHEPSRDERPRNEQSSHARVPSRGEQSRDEQPHAEEPSHSEPFHVEQSHAEEPSFHVEASHSEPFHAEEACVQLSGELPHGDPSSFLDGDLRSEESSLREEVELPGGRQGPPRETLQAATGRTGHHRTATAGTP